MKWLWFFLSVASVVAADVASLVADREAIERVYYHHRIGDQPSFEKTLSSAQIRELVQRDLWKETVLRKHYGIEINEAQVTAEILRINSATRAPETLAELRAALGNDANRFARSVVKPLLVERELRERFDNDSRLHTQPRQEMERAREKLLRDKAAGASLEKLVADLGQPVRDQLSEKTFWFGARREQKPDPAGDGSTEHRKHFGPATPIPSSTAVQTARKLYFEDLPGALKQVLRAQLRQAGDVSAVIEMPEAFTLYLAKERTAESLSVLIYSLPKRSYEEWLDEQHESKR